jgi:hypothetical protein
MSQGRSIAGGVFAVFAVGLAAVGGGGAPPSEAPEDGFATLPYEGRLVSDGLPVDGIVDLEFRAFDAPVDGVQVGPTLYADGVLVDDGSFFVTLDFADFTFDPARHWVQMSVDGEAMLPRRRLVQTFDLNQEVAGAEAAKEREAGRETAAGRSGRLAGGGRFAGGARFDPHDPGSLWGLGGEGEGDPDENPFTAETNDRPGGFEDATGVWNTRGNEYYYKNAFVGVGVGNPAYNLDVRSNGSRTLNVDNKDSSGTRYGIYARSRSASGRAVYGYASAKTGSNYGLYGRTLSANGCGVLGFASATTGLNYGVYGQTNSVSGYSGFFTSSNAAGNVVRLNRGADQAGTFDILELILGGGSANLSQFIECEMASGDVKYRVFADGEVTADGSFTGGGADVAEMMHVSTGAASVGPGDVLVIDVSEAGSIAVSQAARSTLVAGVHSTRPALIASEHDWDEVERTLYGVTPEGEERPGLKPLDLGAMIDEIPLAVVGIVPCKVSAENGPIRVGDLLVTSSTPGHAMRDPDPRTGTVVGKALGALESGTGVIRILMSLQ